MDGRLNHRKKSAFSNCSSVVWTGPKSMALRISYNLLSFWQQRFFLSKHDYVSYGYCGCVFLFWNKSSNLPAAVAAACFCFAINFLLRSVDPWGIFTFNVCSSGDLGDVTANFGLLEMVTLTSLTPNLKEARILLRWRLHAHSNPFKASFSSCSKTCYKFFLSGLGGAPKLTEHIEYSVHVIFYPGYCY